MFRVIDTMDGIKKLRAEVIKGGDTFQCWLNYLSDYPTIKSECLLDAKNYDFKNDIEPVIIDALIHNFDKIEFAHQNMRTEIERIEQQFKTLFMLNEPMDIIFYIGLCNGAGWVIENDGRQTVLLGAEKIVELNWHLEEKMIALLDHELCHVAHALIRGHSLDVDGMMQKEQSAWQLYIEGFAQYYQQVLFQMGYYHQNSDGWLDWCQKNHKYICRSYLSKMNGGESTQCFFGDWTTFMGYSDVGYYLGCEFIRWLTNKYSMLEIACLDFSTVMSYLDIYLALDV